MIYAGIGCRRDCSAQDILAAIERCGTPPALLAVPDFKRDEPGILAAAATLRLRLVVVPRAELQAAQPRCVTTSHTAQAATGLRSVAEAAALAAAGPRGRLLHRRVAQGGATCALAERPA